MKNSIIQYVCMILLSCALLFGMYTSTTLEQYKVKIPVTVSSCDRSPVYFQINSANELQPTFEETRSPNYVTFATEDGSQFTVHADDVYVACSGHVGQHLDVLYTESYVLGKRITPGIYFLQPSWSQDSFEVHALYYTKSQEK